MTRDQEPAMPNSDKPSDPAAEAHRLHRKPDNVDGLEKDDQASRSSRADTVRSETSQKGYTTETETYANPAVDGPTDADQRRDGAAGARTAPKPGT
jgi:hypothetical protein